MKTTILPVLSAPFGIAPLAALVLAMSAFPAAAAPSLAEALDNAELLFTTVGDGEWYGQTDASHDGVDAARTGPLLDGQDSWLQTTVTGPGTLSFWWNVSSEEGADTFELYAAPGSPPSRTSCSRAAKTCGRSRCSRDRRTIPPCLARSTKEPLKDARTWSR